MAGAYLAASRLTADMDGVLGARAGKVSMDGYSLGGSWAQMGLGLTGQIAKNLTAFAAFDYNQGLGSSKSSSVSGRIGLQFAW